MYDVYNRKLFAVCQAICFGRLQKINEPRTGNGTAPHLLGSMVYCKQAECFSMPKGVPNKRYTPEFKKLVAETMQQEKLSYREAAQRFEIGDHH